MAKKVQRVSGSALDLAMAAFAGTAAGFIVFAMPNWQFDRAVELSGLPLILSAAQPPLGMSGRMVAVAAAALGIWALVWLVLRALGQKPPEPRRQRQPIEIEVPLPRLRRADAHPDAPARRPILAGLELGTPLDQVAEAEQASDERLDEEEQPEPFAEEELALDQSMTDYSFSHEAQLDEPELEEAMDVPEVRDSVPPAEPAGEHERTSISHLMQRLELGLLRREHPSWADSPGETQQNNEPPLQIDQRLRSAIDDLQRLAARGG
jgi:hypothetical protein